MHTFKVNIPGHRRGRPRTKANAQDKPPVSIYPPLLPNRIHSSSKPSSFHTFRVNVPARYKTTKSTDQSSNDQRLEITHENPIVDTPGHKEPSSRQFIHNQPDPSPGPSFTKRPESELLSQPDNTTTAEPPTNPQPTPIRPSDSQAQTYYQENIKPREHHAVYKPQPVVIVHDRPVVYYPPPTASIVDQANKSKKKKLMRDIPIKAKCQKILPAPSPNPLPATETPKMSYTHTFKVDIPSHRRGRPRSKAMDKKSQGSAKSPLDTEENLQESPEQNSPIVPTEEEPEANQPDPIVLPPDTDEQRVSHPIQSATELSNSFKASFTHIFKVNIGNPGNRRVGSSEKRKQLQPVIQPKRI
ncbi:hypothetical protein CLU79DRAFT_749967 [Phycomyces nitens]|nr:hypothetical protein CLU79DRAFT_749967 [Phycomyces nitens]